MTNEYIKLPTKNGSIITTYIRLPFFGGGTPPPIPPAGPDTGVFAGGIGSSLVDIMEYINISVLSNAATFGTLAVLAHSMAGCASSTRGVFAGGLTPTVVNTIKFITLATTSSDTPFGNLLATNADFAGCSNATRGIFGGTSTNLRTMQYITIASTGNSISFGNLTIPGRGALASCSSTTRGIFAGGRDASSFDLMRIDYVTIAATPPVTATTFGNLTIAREDLTSCSSNIRGVFAGGWNDIGTRYSRIDYITIASTGNATNFGNLALATTAPSGVCNGLRGVFAGGVTSGSGFLNTMEYITITATPPVTTTNFGTLSVARGQIAGVSGSHGGL